MSAAIPPSVAVRSDFKIPAQIDRKLNGLRFRCRWSTTALGVAQVLSLFCAILLVQGALDWLLDFPWVARALLLLGDLAGLGWLVWIRLIKPLRQPLTRPQLVRMVEKKWPELQQSLITGLELATGNVYLRSGSPQLSVRVLDIATRRTQNLNFLQVVDLKPVRKWILIAVVLLASLITVIVLTAPTSSILLKRIFLFGSALPTRTVVVAVTRDLVAPTGSTVTMSAKATGTVPRHGHLHLYFEHKDTQDIIVEPAPGHTDTFSYAMPNVRKGFTYQFFLNDGKGETFSVEAKEPPNVKNVDFNQIFPEYTHHAPQVRTAADLAIVLGSTLKVSAVSTSPLRQAKLVVQGENRSIDCHLDDSKTKITVDRPVTGKDLTGIALHLIDQTGVESLEDTVYPITVIIDKPPVLKILRPDQETETVIVTAKPVIVFEASDDFGLSALSIHYSLPIKDPQLKDTQGPAQDQHFDIPLPNPPKSEPFQYTVDISSQKPAWEEGMDVSYWIEAHDNNTATGPGVTRSETRHFRIVTKAAKQAEIWEAVQKNVETLNQISDKQTKAESQLKHLLPTP